MTDDRRWVLGALTACGLLLQVGFARAQTDEAVDVQAELLGKWLEHQAAQQRTERRFTGGSLLAVGAGGLGYGLALLLKDSANNELSRGGGVGFVAAGAFGVGLGVFRLAVQSEAEQVAARWAVARAGGVDRQTLARFEGEFFAAAQHARRIQLLTRWLGLATALAGVTVLVATPFADLSDGGAAAGYVGGSLLVVGGGVNLGSSFVTPPPCKAWASYRRGDPPSTKKGRLWSVAPSFDRRSVGLALVGRI